MLLIDCLGIFGTKMSTHRPIPYIVPYHNVLVFASVADPALLLRIRITVADSALLLRIWHPCCGPLLRLRSTVADPADCCGSVFLLLRIRPTAVDPVHCCGSDSLLRIRHTSGNSFLMLRIRPLGCGSSSDLRIRYWTCLMTYYSLISF